MNSINLTLDEIEEFMMLKKNKIYKNIISLRNNNKELFEFNLNINWFLQNNINQSLLLDLDVVMINPKLCTQCRYYRDLYTSTSDVCECKEELVIINKYFEKDINTIIYNIDIKNVKHIQESIYNLIVDGLKIINNVLNCTGCNKLIMLPDEIDKENMDRDKCKNCIWQNIYNSKFGELMDDICCICQETIYRNEAINLCGNEKHSIHSQCKQNLYRCPLCRQQSD